MTYFDEYKARLLLSGTSESDGMHSMAAYTIDKGFKNSPDAIVIKVDGLNTDARFSKSSDKDGFKEYKLLLRPTSLIQVGSDVQVDTLFYLTTDVTSDSLKIKATVEMCNSVLKWINSDGVVKTYNSIVSQVSRYKLIESNVGSTNSIEFIYAYVRKNDDTDSIVPSQRFIMGGKVYQVMGTDNMSGISSNGIGLTQVAVTTCLSVSTDDFINNIADNTLIYQKHKKTDSSSGSIGGNGNLW